MNNCVMYGAGYILIFNEVETMSCDYNPIIKG